MNVELCNPGIFKDAFDSISHIVDEVELDFSQNDGMRLCALDKSHIVFIELEFKVTLFDEFDCPVPEKVIIDTGKFMDILKRMKKTDTLKLSIDEGNFIIIFEGDASRKYKLRLIDVEYESPQPPRVDFPVTVKVPTSVVKDSISDMELFSKYCMFHVDQDYFIVSCDGEFGDGNIKYLHGEQVDDYVKSQLSLDKIKDIFRASKISEECILCMGNDMPIGIELQLVTGDGGIKFLLAPRISAEDE